MIEKVNPMHPDKIADRIAGAIVDMVYKNNDFPKIAVEILIGHEECNIIIETSEIIDKKLIKDIVYRITKSKSIKINILIVNQDVHLSKNQDGIIKCGDNGIFRGVPLQNEDLKVSKIAREIYDKYPYDGKIIYNDSTDLIVCQSNCNTDKLRKSLNGYADNIKVNPLGDWTGGINVDSGATNRKLGSDMGRSVTGGGLHGKDLSKADVSINIFAFIEAQKRQKPVEIYCAIGDEFVCGIKYSEIVEIARDYIKNIGGFEKFAEWGLF